MKTRVTHKIGNSELILETGFLAKQANGAVYVEYEGSAVLATVCCSDNAIEGLDYVPVTVDYNEKYYAAGKIPGGFVKREGRPKDKEILVSRLIDRPMRPLFEKAFGRDIQIVPTCISTDMKNPPDILAVIASSAAVTISDIPFNGPIAAVRIAFVNGEYIVNPTFEQIEKATMEIVVAGTKDGITMVEGGANEVSEEVMLQALDTAHAAIKELCQVQETLREKCGKQKLPLTTFDVELQHRDLIAEEARPEIEKSFYLPSKIQRSEALKQVRAQIAQKYAEQLEDEVQAKLFNALFDELQYTILRKNILDYGKRVDGRGLEDIRPITCDINVLPRPHGSAVFTRGETQSLSVVTLGTMGDEQIYDDIEGERKETFMLHYNFPPYSVGEVGRLATGRREIGHGHLAHRSLKPMLPSQKDFPYTVRVVSEILESNGSSSMATVCAGTLSMLAAGVKMKKPVAGIAMGLITEGEKYAVLSDILGEEDHLGDMDFKVAGTADGITGFQMDIKIAGLSVEIMKKALDQAKRGRLHILSIMNQTISSPAPDISPYAPRIEHLTIPVDKIGALIGPGGKNIQGISEKYSVTINIENDGTVMIYGTNGELAKQARNYIALMTEEPKPGTIYSGVVKRIMEFGAFIEILPGKEGLCHISKLSRKRVAKVTDVLQEGQEVKVKLLEIDKQGRYDLSYIDALEEAEQ
ncbi:MAG: polyribonucleotide nucleotidyltransferase [Spirochaetaceae bacterium]|nr:polyribonucleotide nucleotidyltransferase [Spirochaetaceae bacterium]